MSAAPISPESAQGDVNSIPAIARRAPAFVRTIAIGVAAGAVFGTVLGLALPGSGAQYRAIVATFVASGFALIGGLVAGASVTRERWRRTRIDEIQRMIDTRIAGAMTPIESSKTRTR